jgi:hypothetical protein
VREPLTAEEKMTLKTAAYGAVSLVSNADPGVFSLVKESFAASNPFADATGLVKDALTTGRLPRLPNESLTELEAFVLPMLRRSVAILETKAPQELDNYRSTVVSAIDRAGRASRGVNAAEVAMTAKVRDALGATG